EVGIHSNKWLDAIHETVPPAFCQKQKWQRSFPVSEDRIQINTSNPLIQRLSKHILNYSFPITRESKESIIQTVPNPLAFSKRILIIAENPSNASTMIDFVHSITLAYATWKELANDQETLRRITLAIGIIIFLVIMRRLNKILVLFGLVIILAFYWIFMNPDALEQFADYGPFKQIGSH
ncbi:MAG: hypothetical protein JW706_00480, partial [Opitutales bacterium]|nr:hypothetical protein [Opitutales bacterium]